MTKPYSAYMHTAEPSMPRVPKHWQVLRIKNVGRAIIGLTYDPADVVDGSSNGTLVLRAGNIRDGRLLLGDDVYVAKSVPDDLRLRLNDIVLCARNGSARLVGKNAMATDEVVGQTWGAFMAVLRSAHNTYLRWVLQSQIFAAQTGLFSTSTINQLTSETLHNLRFALPPPDEQRAIADYLDRETARIDTLIDEQRRMVEMLRERRIAVVDVAISEGLHSPARLFETGDRWVPRLPGGWRVIRAKQVLSYGPSNGVSPEAASTGDVRSLSLGAIRDGRVGMGPEVTKFVDRTNIGSVDDYRLVPGDILLVRGNGNVDLVGRAGLVGVEFAAAEYIYPDLLIRVRVNSFMLAEFFVWACNATAVRAQVRAQARTAVGTFKVAGEMVRSLVLPLPPLDEQRRIASYLGEQTAKIDTLIAETEQFIELSRERRSALITAAVTGQIDVRGEAA